MTIKKRGRPVGSKNKLTKVEQKAVDNFAQTLAEWDRKEQEVDFKDLCQKLQEALAKAYCEIEQLERNNTAFIQEMNRQSCIIDYLESRLK